MKIILKDNCHLYYIFSILTVGLTTISGLVLSHITPSYAESANAAVTVSSACTITTTGSSTNTANLIPGGYTEIVSNPIDISCNDNGGYALYAIGYSGDSYDATNHTKLISSLGSDYDIATNTSGSSSYWAMKVATSGTNAPVIDNSYGSYQVIPDTYTEITHRTTSTVGTSNSITTPTYKISIASGQVADTYNGKVKYTLVHPSNAAAPEIPKTYMQNMSGSLCTSTPMEVYDSRGGEQAYMVARLNDGKCWMLQNLNLPGGTALSADDTDVTSTYIDGFTTQGNLTKSGNTIVLPASATKNSDNTSLTDSTQFSDNSNAYVFNSGNNTTTCNSTTPCNSYYSWIAATLGGKQADGSTNQTSNGYNAAASICPKGWRLPTSTISNAPATISPNWKTGGWYALATAYGANLESDYSQSAATFYNNAGPGTTPNFLLAGLYGSGSFYDGGSGGYYWSATSNNSSRAYYLYFSSGFVSSANGYTRLYGNSVRCLLSE